ncbi:MAG: hypothetical protein RhofKO_04410 [Rhodothermales bacterium]
MFRLLAVWVGALLVCLTVATVHAQSDEAPRWALVAPQPGLTADQPVLLTLRWDDETTSPDAFDVRIDGRSYTEDLRWTPPFLTLWLGSGWPAGTYRVEVATTVGAEVVEDVLTYTLLHDPTGAAPRRVRPKADAFTFGGRMRAQSYNTALSGEGAALRQEPGGTHQFELDAEGRYKGIRLPVQLYLTSEENQQLFQPRNRIRVGFESKYLRLGVGDVQPAFNTLMLNRNRVRGVEGEVGVGWIGLRATTGVLRRGLETRIQDILLGDQDAIVPERLLTAARLRIGREQATRWTLSVMKVGDAVTSGATYQDTPKENIVASSSMRLKILEVAQIEGTAAFSLTTDDIARGPSSAIEIDTTLGLSVPVDPLDYEQFLIINTSTYPVEFDNLTSLAWRVQSQVDLPGHLLRGSIEEIGEAYVSLANPFLRNDREGWEVSDQMNLFAGRVRGLVRYRTTAERFAGDRTTERWQGQYTVAPVPGGPRILAGYQLQERTTEAATQTARDRTTSVRFGALHAFTTGQVQHFINVFALDTRRTDDLRPERGTDTQLLQVALTERIGVQWSAQGQYLLLTVTSDGFGTLQRNHTYELGGGYAFATTPLQLRLLGRLTVGEQTDLAASSRRPEVNVFGTYQVQHDLSLDVRLGWAAYREADLDSRHYTETFAQLGLRYRFGSGR